VEGDPAPRKDIESLVRDIIVEQLGTPAERVTLKARLIEDLGADSLDLVELTMALEEKFEIEIKDSDCGKLLTVGDIVEYVRTHRKRP
jgi:acyl carrier protein